MKTQKIVFKSDGLNIYGEVFFPEGKKGKIPAVCLCHGIPAERYNPKDRGWAITAEQFCTAGFISMVFNFRGSGLSEGNFDMLGWANDLQAALEKLFSFDEVDKKRVYLLGSSGGSATCVYVTAQYKMISGLVTFACPAYFSFRNSPAETVLGHFRSIGIIRDKDFPASKEAWLQSFETISPVRWINKISPCHLLILHGENDELVPVDQARELYDLAGEPKQISILPGTGHRMRLEERAVNAALDWLKQQS